MSSNVFCPKCGRFHEKNVKCGVPSRYLNEGSMEWPRGHMRNVPRYYEDEEEFDPMYFFTGTEQKPWLTVIPLGITDISPEDVKVKLNPLCRILIIKVTCDKRVVRGSSKVIQRVLTLPPFIKLEKLRVKLTRRGELVVFAPIKTSYQGKMPSFEYDEETLNSPFFQERGLPKGLTWKTIPIIGLFKAPFRGRHTERFEGNVSPLWREEESEVTTTDEETEDDWETEGEEDDDVFPETFGRRTSNLKLQVLALKRLFEKTFYPNLVDVNVVPKGTTRFGTVMRGTKEMEMVVSIKFIDFASKELKVRLDTRRGNVLIVEGMKLHGSAARHMIGQKFLHREIELPEWLMFEEMDYKVLPNGVLRIHLPLKSVGMSPLVGYYRTRSYPRNYYYSYLKKGMTGSKWNKNYGYDY